MPIETWFPTVIFFEDIEVPEAVRQPVLEAVASVADPAALHPGDRTTASDVPNTLHLDARLDALFERLLPAVRRFLFDELCLDEQRSRFYVGRCWPVLQGPDAEGSTHIHDGALISGVFYLETPAGSGGIEFNRPTRSVLDRMAKREFTPLNYEKTIYEAARNRLLLFASDIKHRALASDVDTPGVRVAIAFDVYATADPESPEGGMPHPHALKPIR